METYNGHIRTPADCLILFEACRLGLLPRVQRRLSEKERQSIRTGSVFVWDEREAGMRRWTDGKSWSASRVAGCFLTYREMEGKRGGTVAVSSNKGSRPAGSTNSQDGADGEADEGPDGYRYKPDGLMKQSFSLTTSTGQALHLISYYSRAHPTTPILRQPTTDPSLTHIQIPKGMYPESTLADASNSPAVTRSPMPGAPGYVMAGGASFQRPAPPPGFMPGFVPHPGYVYPMSPVHTPPGYSMYPPPGYPAYPGYPHQIPNLAVGQAPPSIFDQRPLNRQPSGQGPPLPPTTAGPSESGRAASFHEINQQALALAGHVPMPPHLKQDAQSPPQIDPRLQAGAPPGRPASTGSPSQQLPLPISQAPRPYDPVSAATTQSMSALASAAATGSFQNPRPGQDREGSVSPGGTRRGAPPQDIPSEKFPFKEDKMALSKLDRVFARV